MDETILLNIEKMLFYRSQLRKCPSPYRDNTINPPVFYTWDTTQNKFIQTFLLYLEKFTTKQYYSLDMEKNYIILTDKSIHYELRKRLSKNRNVELFNTTFFKINKLDYVPKHTLYSDQNLSYKKKLPRLLLSDPIVLFCKFYPGEVVNVGDHLRIVIE